MASTKIAFRRLTGLCLILICLLSAVGFSHAWAEELTPRESFINDIISVAKHEYDELNGKARRAHYAGDRYVCKNFTVYLFREACGKYAIAEYPSIGLIIPDNKTREECKPYANGVAWKDIPASDGNPFYEAASFRYDTNLSKEENRQLAREFMRQVQRGDYFQMAANYYYGVGPHSLVFIADYDPDTDSVHWTDSNMKGVRRDGGIRYGYVQYDAVKEIDWFVDAFCRKQQGASIYRLRDDIIFRED